MLIEEVYDIDAEAFERGFRHFAHMLRPAVEAGHGGGIALCRIDLEAELGGDDHLIPIGL
ncbi:hypothetical protein D3C87_1764960 [compost metagenome]